METLRQDLRFALRNLRRQPGFALTALLTLALGIGATTAIFSVVHAVILRPLPYPDSDRIVAVQNHFTNTGGRGQVAAPDFHDWREQSRSFSALAYYVGGETSVNVAGNADYGTAIRVTPGFFDVLGIAPQLGRLWTPEEQRAGGPLAVIITDAFWRRQFNGHPSAVGSAVKFGERLYEIVGILPPGLRFPARTDIYYPAWIAKETGRSAHNYRVIGRLADGVTVAQADDEMKAIAARLSQQYPVSNGGKSAAVDRLQEILVGNSRTTLYMLLAAVSFVLLIACANVANLLLARATVRGREMVVRAAIGAGRGRLVRQLLTESILIGVIAGILGVVLARAGVATLVALAPPDLPRVDEIHVDTFALGFALAISVASSILFGMAPAVQVSRVQLAEGLRQGGKGSALGARGGWARNAFVVAEIALAVVLVAGAGLLGRSLVALATVELGFAREQLLVMRTAVPVPTFDEAPRATAFYRDLLPELRAVPGVTSVAGVTSLPTVVRSSGGYWLEGGPGPEQQGIRSPQAIFNVVTPDYFRTMRVPLKAGRDFTDGDRRDAPFVAIINEALAGAAFPNEDPIGRRIQAGLDSLEFMTVVGVVADVRTGGPTRPVQPEIYMAYEQHPGPATALNIVARTQSPDPLALTETMQVTLDTAAATPRFRTFLLALFAGVALMLAVAGVYGVMAYTVGQRVPEIAVRVALGAAPADIMKMVVGQGARLAGVGLVVGMALALAMSRLVEGLLFGVRAQDPAILVSVTLLVATAALAACYVPGRRALRVEPMIALRSE